jgi:protein subunit release factor B
MRTTIKITPGAGGIDACVFVHTLKVMYLRWAKSAGHHAEMLIDLPTEAMLSISGDVYPHLQHEAGVHRLVRRSPYDAASRRITCFATVEVWTPAVEGTLAEKNGQIRSYVLDPYRLVKDHRTGYDTANVDAVLGGDLSGFFEAWKNPVMELNGTPEA